MGSKADIKLIWFGQQKTDLVVQFLLFLFVHQKQTFPTKDYRMP